MSTETKEKEQLQRLDAEMNKVLSRLATLEERVSHLAHAVDQLRPDFAEEPETLEKA